MVIEFWLLFLGLFLIVCRVVWVELKGIVDLRVVGSGELEVWERSCYDFLVSWV